MTSSAPLPISLPHVDAMRPPVPAPEPVPEPVPTSAPLPNPRKNVYGPALAGVGPLMSPVTPGASLPSVQVSTPQSDNSPASLPSPVRSASSRISPDISHSLANDKPDATSTTPRENGRNESSISYQPAPSAPPAQPSLTPTTCCLADVQTNALCQFDGGLSLGSMQNPPPQQTTLRTSSVTPSEDDWQRWMPAFEYLREQAEQTSKVAAGRIILLENAYKDRDIFYLVVHQVYCRQSVGTQQPWEHEIPELRSSDVQQGFMKLIDLLEDNSKISPTIMSIFVELPTRLEDLMHTEWCHSNLKLLTKCLPRLAEQFVHLRDRIQSGYYHHRRYPPLVGEMKSQFELPSSVLLGVIFASTCRHIYPEEHLPHLQSLFKKDTEAELVGSTKHIPALIKAYHAIPMKPLVETPQSQPLQRTGPPTTVPSPSTTTRAPMALPASPVVPILPSELVSPRGPQDSPTTTPPHGWQPPPTMGQPYPPQLAAENPPFRWQSVPGYMQQPYGHVPQAPQAPQNSHVSVQRVASQPQAQMLDRQPNMTVNFRSAQQMAPTGQQPFTLPQQPYGSQGTSQIPQFQPGRSPHVVSALAPTSPIVSSRISSPQTPQMPPTRFFPVPGYRVPQVVHPNPMLLGLHQADLRDPIKKLVRRGLTGLVDSELFFYLHGFAMPPTFIDPEEMSFEYNFNVSQDDLRRVPRLEISNNGKQPVTCFQPGCTTVRLRAIALGSSNKDKVYDLWPTTTTSWPSVFYIHVNNKELFVRRKSHNGKDLPLDITHCLIEGENKLSLHFLLEPGECKNFRYVFGIESMLIHGYDQVRRQATTIPAYETRERIQKRLSSTTDDDDLAVVSDSLTVGLIDPFMAQIYNTPARSRNCDHLECFDIDTFIDTRKSQSGPAALNDNWQCPICKADARPSHLIIDDFFVNVRTELVSSGRLEGTTAIDIRADGSWTTKVVSDEHSALDQNKSSTISVKRKATGSLDRAASRSKQEPSPSIINHQDHTVIEID